MIYLDIHTHKKKTTGLSIINCSSNFGDLPASGFFSLGIHPWYINEKTEHQFNALVEISKQPNVLAIGECGLDKMCDTNFTLQQQYFIKQIQLANTLHKPIIIHCVRAYNETMRILEQQKVQVPVIFHGFNKNSTLAKELTDKGYYLSFGKHVLNTSVTQTFKTVPPEKIFLETDNGDTEIEAIYQAAATIKKIDITNLTQQLTKNALHVFGKNFTV